MSFQLKEHLFEKRWSAPRIEGYKTFVTFRNGQMMIGWKSLHLHPEVRKWRTRLKLRRITRKTYKENNNVSRVFSRAHSRIISS